MRFVITLRGECEVGQDAGEDAKQLAMALADTGNVEYNREGGYIVFRQERTLDGHPLEAVGEAIQSLRALLDLAQIPAPYALGIEVQELVAIGAGQFTRGRRFSA